MKSFIAKAALVVLPLVAFSTPSFSFAAQDVVAAKQQASSHIVKVKKQSHQNLYKECCQTTSVARGDDESVPSQFSTKELKKRYEE